MNPKRISPEAGVRRTAPTAIFTSWEIPSRLKGAVLTGGHKGFQGKMVALTFDDGPNRVITPLILDILRKYQVHATFFVLGSEAAHAPEMLPRIVREGHAIGIHSYSHTRFPSQKQAVYELNRCQEQIRKLTGRTTHLFRPPYGRLNTNYVIEAKRQGLLITLWNRSAADTSTKNLGDIVSNCVDQTRSGDVILMHDAENKRQSLKALPIILLKLKKRGLRCVTLPEMLAAEQKRRVDSPVKTPALSR